MAALTMKIEATETETLEVTVEDSLLVTGAFVSVVKRLEFPPSPEDLGGLRARAAIEAQWGPVQDQALEIFNKIRGLA